MGITDVADQYFTYESRVASFQTAQQLSKRRASNASTKAAKSMKWPHKFMSADELAKAGFFYYPQQNNPDNVACFLCHKSLDGWEENDDPLAEHLKHSPDCGWAIVASIEKLDGVLSLEYPSSARMIEARKATFADKWPHEGKKGWKCKTKQLVDAGWKYTPTPEYDDMATCAYCNLALDGWENSDKPLDEHFKRSPECTFFSLINEHLKSPAPKRAKSKRDRTSKASRLSTQSSFTIASEAPSDLPAEDEDSILTTATNATFTKMGKPKKTAAKKGRTRAKKGEPIEVYEAPEPEDDNFDVKVEVAPKATRGRKRKSEDSQEVDENMDVAPPAAKRRNTRTRGSTAINDSIISQADEPSRPAGRKGRPSRKVSTASVASTSAPVPDDEDIDMALEADLERRSAEDEIEIAPVSVLKKATRASKITKADHAMFDAAPAIIDEAAIDAELDAMEVDSQPLPKAKGAKGKQPRKVSAKQRAADKKEAEAKAAAEAEAEAEQLEEDEASQQIAAELEHSISMHHSSPVIQTKKQRAPASKAPKRATGRTTRGSVLSVVDSTICDNDEDVMDEPGNESDASMASQSTVVRGGSTRRGSTMRKATSGKKGPSRHIEEIVHRAPEPVPEIQVEVEAEAVEAVVPHKSKRLLHVEETSIVEERFYTPAPEMAVAEPTMVEEEPVIEEEPAPKPAKKASKGKSKAQKKSSAEIESTPQVERIIPQEITQPEPITTKAASPARSPTPPPKEKTPSLSPQSSDAENQPPSSKPSALAQNTTTPISTRRRIPLADATPILSPSKRNVIAGLQSNRPWSSIDLDTIFMKSPGVASGAVVDLFGGVKDKVESGGLSSPEKNMTVEEWIQHNAAMAEEKLRSECERMVGAFERQGGRAMAALEGVECIE